MRRVFLALAAVLTSAGSPVLAQSLDGVEDMVVIGGSCPRFTVSGISYQCKTAVYSHHTNGRTALQFDTPHGAIMFSGGSDSQIDPRRYILNVDRIRAGHSGRSQPYPAKGRCVVTLTDASGDYVRSISCDAANGTERVKVEFRGNGKKIDKLL
jgi:hypothetical protein